MSNHLLNHTSGGGVLHVVSLRVKGLAGLLVKRSLCRDTTGDSRSAPAPQEIRAVIEILQDSQTRGLTSPSRSLKLSPTEDTKGACNSVSQDCDAEQGPESQIPTRYVAVWCGDESASITFEVILPKSSPATSHLSSTRKNMELIVNLTDGSSPNAVVPVGKARFTLTTEQIARKSSLDVPVHAFSLTKGESLTALQPFDSDLSSSIRSAYSIDESGDAVLRVQVEVEEKEFNFEVDWEEPSPFRPSAPHKPFSEKSVGLVTKGKPVVKVLDPSTVPTETLPGSAADENTSCATPIEPSIERVLSSLEEKSHASVFAATEVANTSTKAIQQAAKKTKMIPFLRGKNKKQPFPRESAMNKGVLLENRAGCSDVENAIQNLTSEFNEDYADSLVSIQTDVLHASPVNNAVEDVDVEIVHARAEAAVVQERKHNPPVVEELPERLHTRQVAEGSPERLLTGQTQIKAHRFENQATPLESHVVPQSLSSTAARGNLYLSEKPHTEPQTESVISPGSEMLVQELRSHARRVPESGPKRPPGDEGPLPDPLKSFSYDADDSFLEEEYTVEDRTHATYEEKRQSPRERTKLFGFLDIQPCGQLQDIVVENLGLDDDSYVEETDCDDDTTVATMDSSLKYHTYDVSVETSGSFSTMARDDISRIPPPPDFLDNMCSRTNFGLRPHVDVYNDGETRQNNISHDLSKKAKALLDDGSVGRRRRRWKEKLRMMALQKSGAAVERGELHDKIAQSNSFYTYEVEGNPSIPSVMRSFNQDGDEDSAFSRDDETSFLDGSSVFSEDEVTSMGRSTAFSDDEETSFSRYASEHYSQLGPYSDQESGTSALPDPQTESYKAKEDHNKSSSDRTQMPTVVEEDSTLSRSLDARSQDSDQVGITGPPVLDRQTGGSAGSFPSKERSSNRKGRRGTGSTRSPSSILEIPFAASLDRTRSITTSFMEAVTCGMRGKYQTSNEVEEVSSIPSFLEPVGDASVGELTQTTHELKIDFERYRQRLELAQQKVGSKVASTRKCAAAYLKPTAKSSQVEKNRVQSLHTVQNEDYFEDYDESSLKDSLASDAVDAAWAKQLAEATDHR